MYNFKSPENHLILSQVFPQTLLAIKFDLCFNCCKSIPNLYSMSVVTHSIPEMSIGYRIPPRLKLKFNVN